MTDSHLSVFQFPFSGFLLATRHSRVAHPLSFKGADPLSVPSVVNSSLCLLRALGVSALAFSSVFALLSLHSLALTFEGPLLSRFAS